MSRPLRARRLAKPSDQDISQATRLIGTIVRHTMPTYFPEYYPIGMVTAIDIRIEPITVCVAFPSLDGKTIKQKWLFLNGFVPVEPNELIELLNLETRISA